MCFLVVWSRTGGVISGSEVSFGAEAALNVIGSRLSETEAWHTPIEIPTRLE